MKSTAKQQPATADSAGSFLSPAGREALRRLEADTTRIRREQVGAAYTARGLDEYHEWAETAA